jgi:hypothetical protein
MSVPGRALAEKRVAVVIRNGAYKAQNLLINPPNDARLISQALTKAQIGRSRPIWTAPARRVDR